MTITQRKKKIARKIAKLITAEHYILGGLLICYAGAAMVLETSFILALIFMGLSTLAFVMYLWADARIKNYEKTYSYMDKRQYRKPIIIRMEHKQAA